LSIGPRKLLWIENNDARCMGTGAGTFTTYKGEFVMVIAGSSLEACQRLFCDMLRTRGEFKPDE
jgi:hypothetical protein